MKYNELSTEIQDQIIQDSLDYMDELLNSIGIEISHTHGSRGCVSFLVGASEVPDLILALFPPNNPLYAVAVKYSQDYNTYVDNSATEDEYTTLDRDLALTLSNVIHQMLSKEYKTLTNIQNYDNKGGTYL